MAEQQSNTAAGVVGRLGSPPRKALGSSAIAAEQAYRKRSGLPLLTEEDIAALKAGEPMPWERGEGTPAESAPPATPPAASATASPAPSPAPVAGSAPTAAGAVSAEVAAMMAGGRKWSRSSIAAEQARRKRTGLTPLTDAEVAALLGEAAPAAAAAVPAALPAAPNASPAAAVPARAAPAARPTPAAVPVGTAVAREGAPTRYVGTPAVGTSKAAAAGGVAATGPENTEVDKRRRRLVWSGVAAFLAAWLLAFFRFFLPRTLFEPSTVFKIGYPTDYGLGVTEKWLQAYRIWVDRTPDRLFVIYARCTHLGCTPDWKAAENKFKCPCHGSGYDSEGVNFEGPAPRPMDRAHIELAPDGQIQVDSSRLYHWPKGQRSEFDDAGAYLTV